jgi:hypothetical protein
MPLYFGPSSLIGLFLSSLISKMKALPSCSSLLTIYQPTWRHTLDDLYSQQRRYDNLIGDQMLCSAVTFLTPGRKVLGSDLDSNTAYPEGFCFFFFSHTTRKYRCDVSVATVLNRLPSNCVVRVTDSVVL